MEEFSDRDFLISEIESLLAAIGVEPDEGEISIAADYVQRFWSADLEEEKLEKDMDESSWRERLAGIWLMDASTLPVVVAGASMISKILSREGEEANVAQSTFAFIESACDLAEALDLPVEPSDNEIRALYYAALYLAYLGSLWSELSEDLEKLEE